ncbi:hypothetical protein [Halosegnis sp.]|uniref:hypothetical protein n=1 Tax=Halosegnis sp. TaxID=2864959 RepID=UPI0035D4D8C9
MAESGRSYDTRVETNRWESFTRLTFVYFADEGYSVSQRFDPEQGSYEVTFTDDDRDERAVFVYEGSPPDMARESLQQLQRLMTGTADLSRLWTDALTGSSGSS